tara:strand:+ start:17990 stop:18274 length:285 start_codon:yes stop_codon:yes gene_type:complete
MTEKTDLRQLCFNPFNDDITDIKASVKSLATTEGKSELDILAETTKEAVSSYLQIEKSYIDICKELEKTKEELTKTKKLLKKKSLVIRKTTSDL